MAGGDYDQETEEIILHEVERAYEPHHLKVNALPSGLAIWSGGRCTLVRL
jgi:hypothetical protein